MTYSKNNPQKDKISHQFKARLDCLDPQQKIRGIVMIKANCAGEASSVSC